MHQNSSAINENIAILLSAKFGRRVLVNSVRSVSGGCINECFEVLTTHGKFFLKQNLSENFSDLFESEVKGLELLNNAVAGITPNIISVNNDGQHIRLILEWIEPGKPSSDFWQHFAKQTALLHQQTQHSFGLDHHNFIGSLKQNNHQMNDWISFFILQRIEPQLKKAIDENKLPKQILKSFENMFSKLSDFFPIEKPALLHGDLWSGNFLTDHNGRTRLIDPAVYYGHREMDLAMTKLFGGFERSFYSIYQEYFPLEKGFEKRMKVQQLYPLLVHVNLFGVHYPSEVTAIINRFT